MKYALPILAIVIAIGSMVYANAKISANQKMVDEQISKLKKSSVHVEHHEEEIEVAEYMRALQWNMSKLYFAGMNNNSELVKFYVHEVEEVMEDVAYAGVIDDGIPISKHMKTYGVEAVEVFEKEMITDFGPAYTNLMNSCNSCHLITEHGFIKIKTPETPITDNQVF